MREARAKNGLISDGEGLVVYRPRPHFIEKNETKKLMDDEETTFATWKDDDPLPTFRDDITGHNLVSPPDDTMHEVERKLEDLPVNFPGHPSFGPESVVPVPQSAGASQTPRVDLDLGETNESGEERPAPRSRRRVKVKGPHAGLEKRRFVKDRWFYEPVLDSKTTTLTCSLSPAMTPNELELLNEEELMSEPDVTEEAEFLTSKLMNATDKYEAAIMIQPADENFTDINKSERPGVRLETSLLPNLGPMEALPDYLLDLEDTEETARIIQGMGFRDEEYGWCEVTGWDVDHGVKVVYYMPKGQRDLAHEHHTSLSDLLSIIKCDPVLPKLTDYKSSRLLRRSASWSTQGKVMRLLSVKRRILWGGKNFIR